MSLLQYLESIFIISSVGVIATLLAKFIRLPLALMLVLCGFVFSLFIVDLGIDTGIRAHNFQDLIFFVFLPVLIFEAAYNIDQQQLLRYLGPILILAVIGLIVSTLITAVSIYYAIGYGFPFVTALLAGVMLSATDPVAVVDQLKRLAAPKDLAVLIEGESLFNDATAIVLFSILLALALNPAEAITPGAVVLQFAKVFFGGVVCGAVSGFIAVMIVRLVDNYLLTAFVSLLTAYVSFYIAEHLLHVSGVMSVLIAALVMAGFKQKMASDDADKVQHIWEFLAFIFNVLIFVVMGIVITLDMFAERWLAMIIAIIAVLAARLISVYLSAALSGTVLRKPIASAHKPVLVWGGLRGAIAIALVLSLPVELEFWWTVQSMVFGVVLFTLAVQSPSNGWLLKKLKLTA